MVVAKNLGMSYDEMIGRIMGAAIRRLGLESKSSLKAAHSHAHQK